jgi:ABC-type uncharacterized transport system
MSRSWTSSALLAFGMVLTWAGERVAEAGTWRQALSELGAAAILAAVAWRAQRMRKAAGEAKSVETALFGLFALALAGIVLYYAQSDVLAKLDGKALAATAPKLASAVAALFPVLLAAAAFPIFLMELAYAAMARAPKLETGRVRDAMYSGLGLASALVFAFTAQYVAGERDVKADFSYFRTARPGDGTQKLVASFTEPVLVSLFFPPANEVSEQVREYFKDLAQAGKLQVSEYDHALEPAKARELGVSANGTVVFQRGGRKEVLFIGQDLDKSRPQLKSIDKDVSKKLLLIARSARTIYMTTGHGERGEENTGGDSRRATVSLLKNELRGQNYEVKTLSAAEGLASELPKDASAVMILGPREAFSPPEAAALVAYQKRGGKVFIALDPENGLDFKELLEPLGLSFSPVTLVNDAAYARKTGTKADRAIIGTRAFSSHPAATTNSREGYPMFAMSGGAVEELKSHPAELVVDFPVRAEATTWQDTNNNFENDAPAEIRKAYGLAAAVTRKAPAGKPEEELRALVLGDSDAIGDEVIQGAKGNAYFVLDGLKWLLGDESTAGATNTEADSPVMRTNQQDKVWFFATIVLGPVAVLVLGAFMRRKAKGGAVGTAKKAGGAA